MKVFISFRKRHQEVAKNHEVSRLKEAPVDVYLFKNMRVYIYIHILYVYMLHTYETCLPKKEGGVHFPKLDWCFSTLGFLTHQQFKLGFPIALLATKLIPPQDLVNRQFLLLLRRIYDSTSEDVSCC